MGEFLSCQFNYMEYKTETCENLTYVSGADEAMHVVIMRPDAYNLIILLSVLAPVFSG